MKVDGDSLGFSPSDLTAYLACEHLTQLGLRVARHELRRPHDDDPQSDLVRLKGEEHEAAYLRRLREEGRDVVGMCAAGRDKKQQRCEKRRDSLHMDELRLRTMLAK